MSSGPIDAKAQPGAKSEQPSVSFYAHKAIEAGWSRNVLVTQIEAGLYNLQGKADTNFQRALPPADSDLA